MPVRDDGTYLALGAIGLLAGVAVAAGRGPAVQTRGGMFSRGARNVLEDLRMRAQQGDGQFFDYFPESAAGQMQIGRRQNLAYGRNVIWDGIEGQMLRVDPTDLVPMDGNIWDFDKLAAVVSGIENAEDRVVLTAGYGTPMKITLTDVRESLEMDDEDEGIYTTGDEDLDAYLRDPEEALAMATLGIYNYQDEVAALCAERARLQAGLAQAEADDDGDLGRWIVQVRDGNHRAFGAVLAGEPYVWIMVDDNTMQDVRNQKRPEDVELGKMLE